MTRIITFLFAGGCVLLVSLIGTRLASLNSQEGEQDQNVAKVQEAEPDVATQNQTVRRLATFQSQQQPQDTAPFMVQSTSQPAVAVRVPKTVQQYQDFAVQPRTTTVYPGQSGVTTTWRSDSNFFHSVTANNETMKAFRQLQKAESDEEKKDAEEDLRDALEDEYDASLEGYEKNLEALAAKLKKLEDELERRRSAKRELVDLRLKTLVNQAEGLGWPGQGFPGMNQNSFQYYEFPANVISPPSPIAPQPGKSRRPSRSRSDARPDKSDRFEEREPVDEGERSRRNRN